MCGFGIFLHFSGQFGCAVSCVKISQCDSSDKFRKDVYSIERVVAKKCALIFVLTQNYGGVTPCLWRTLSCGTSERDWSVIDHGTDQRTDRSGGGGGAAAGPLQAALWSVFCGRVCFAD